jgi:hypothetical protein
MTHSIVAIAQAGAQVPFQLRPQWDRSGRLP